MPTVRVALAQINTVVGDIDGNVERVLSVLERVADDQPDVVVFPEMTITGYPPEDLVLKSGFVADSRAAVERLATQVVDTVAVVGFADGSDGDVFNSAAVCSGGSVIGTYHKRELPNYSVFDEERHFSAGTEPMRLYDIAGVRVGISICEDSWVAGGPVNQLATGGAQLIVNINGSPFYSGKMDVRETMLRDRVTESGVPIVYLNLVGGQDELIFDGGSMVVDREGNIVARSPQFVEHVQIVDIDVSAAEPPITAFPTVPTGVERRDRAETAPGVVTDLDARIDQLHDALVLATRDYVVKNGFTDVCLGLSGGIDSALVAALAAEALGPENVHAVLMPSRYSSDHSISDAEALSENLGISYRTIPIEPGHQSFLDMLAPSFEGAEPDLTEENLQSRIRGVLLMALTNKFGWLVLTTGNKSEAAVGYSTLYGDTAGAYAVIKDVYKLDVYRLCERINERHGREVVPVSIIEKPPSAELRPDQRDDQSLPPYEELDPLLEAYIEGDRTAAELVAMGFDESTAKRITRLVDISEFKRRQTPLGARVTTKGFGRDRRLPITSRYR